MFTNGDIIVFNAKLNIQNCELRNVVIFLMALDKYVGDYAHNNLLLIPNRFP